VRLTVVSGVMILALILAQSAHADKIVLKSGESVEGTLANREAVLASPQLQTQFSLLRSGSEELVRFAAEEVDYLVLEGEGDPVVIDLASLSADLGSIQSSTDDLDEIRSSQTSAVVETRKISGKPLIFFGAAMAAVGAVVKFGDEKLTATSSGVDFDEKSYNKANYALMAGGGILFVSGLVIESSKSRDAGQNGELARLPGQQVGWSGPTVGLRLRF
jgi:hypothetical protein